MDLDQRECKYFHELTGEEYELLKVNKTQWDEVKQKHPQPAWCHYPDALDGIMGCWTLLSDRHKISESFCNGCEFCTLKNDD